jgi:hypothetical protein
MGELVRGQPRMAVPARETWLHAGLRCAIVASPMGGWNGYVQLPLGSRWRWAGWLDVPIDGLTWGPDPDGWVGFDTGHAWDAWAPDDDSPPYQPAWWPGPPGPVPDHIVAALRLLRRQTATMLGGTTWTLRRLRRKVEDLAERLAVDGG